MGLLDGKVAVITGGSRGLGFGIAEAYAREGAAVVIASRSASSVADAVALLRGQGARASGLACDVADPVQVEAVAAHALEQFGTIDLWVNNAGLSAPYGPTTGVSPRDFRTVVDTNIVGTYNGSMVALRHFLPAGKGKLINILGRGDRGGPVPLQNAYAASKAWVRSFTLALAKENRAGGVGIFAFNPGMVLTEMLTRVQVVEGWEGSLKSFPTILRMWANPVPVPVRKAVWLASAATDGKTGLELHVMSPGSMLAGALKEGVRRLLHLPGPEIAVTIQPKKVE